DGGSVPRRADRGGHTTLESGPPQPPATNEWQTAEWREPEPRLRGSICAAYEAPDLTAAEIHRAAKDKQFVQVLLSARTAEPLGRRKYWKMYEAALEHELPVAFHFGGSGGGPITAAGFPSFYYEDHAGMPPAFEAQVI